MIAAQAERDRWRAAEAAARARQATAEANTAEGKAQDSAEAAKDYADDAEASADAAEESASKAANSAKTARSAAQRGNTDALAAEGSAADAEFSAAYARQTAKEADDSADRARASATAAGKSATKADAEAEAAWKNVLKLAEQEIEEELKRVKEARKAQEGASEVFCMDILPFDTSMAPWLNTVVCDDGAIDRALELTKDPKTYGKAAFELSGLADIQACIDNPAAVACALAVVSVTPWGKLKLISKVDKGIEALKKGRATRRTVACLTDSAHSFPAGTLVLMADGTRRPIEQIRIGDSVTATDPVSDETGPRTVTRTIHTPDDRNFTGLTLTDGSTLTSTSHHPYWSEDEQTWKDASGLSTGGTLRTPQNTTATIADTRDWQGLQDAYDLTVDEFHTYYVSTSTTDILVHNNNGACPTWVKNAWDELPLEGSTTSGYVFTADGKKLWNTPVESGRNSTTEEISRFLQGSPDFPYIPGYSPLAHHAEVKTAWAMRNDGRYGDVLHIVINKNYLCPKVTDAVQVGCKQSVPAILYEDQFLCVWVPGSSKAVPIPGKVKRAGSSSPPPGGNRCES